MEGAGVLDMAKIRFDSEQCKSYNLARLKSPQSSHTTEILTATSAKARSDVCAKGIENLLVILAGN